MERGLGLPEAEQVIQRYKAALSAEEARLSELGSKLAAEDGRPNAIRERLAELKQKQSELSALAQPAAETAETPLFAEARAWLQSSHEEAVRSEIQMLEEELLSRPMRLGLMNAQRDRAGFDAIRLRARIKAYDSFAINLRQGEAQAAQSAADSAVVEAVDKHPVI